jgi:hypothetical protein
MPSLPDALEAISEFSIGLAGFSAIAAVFANAREMLDDAIRFRVSGLLVTAFGPGFVALTIISLLLAGIEAATAVRIGSAITALYLSCYAVFAFGGMARLSENDRRKLNVNVRRFSSISSFANFGAQLWNVVVMPSYASGILIGGLTLVLATGALTFSQLVIGLVRSHHDAT